MTETLLNALIPALILFAILLGLFMLCRLLVLWYWKIDLIVDLLREIAANTRGTAPAVDVAGDGMFRSIK